MRFLSDEIIPGASQPGLIGKKLHDLDNRVSALETTTTDLTTATAELTEAVNAIDELVTSPRINKELVVASTLVADIGTVNSLESSSIDASTLTVDDLTATRANIDAFVARDMSVHAVDADTVTASAISASTLSVPELNPESISASTLFAGTASTGSLTSDTLTSGTASTGSLTSESVTSDSVTASSLVSSSVTTDSAEMRYAKITDLAKGTAHYDWQFQDISTISSDTDIAVIELPVFTNGEYRLVYKNPNDNTVLFAASVTNTYDNYTVAYYKQVLFGGETLSRIAFKDNQVYFETKVPGRLYFEVESLTKADPPLIWGEWPIDPRFADVYEVVKDRATVFTHYANVGTSGEEYGTASFEYITTDDWDLVHAQQEEAPVISYNPGNSVVGRTYVPDQNVNKGSDVEFEDIVSSTLIADAIESRTIDTDTLTASSIVTSSLVAGTGVMASLSVQHGIEASSLVTSTLTANSARVSDSLVTSTLTANSTRVSDSLVTSTLTANSVRVARGIETSTLSTNRLTVASQIIASQANGIFNNIDIAMATAQHLRVTGASELEGNVTIGTALAGADLVVNGNIVQQGETYETHAEQVYTKKDHIILRDSSVSGLIPDEHSGLIVKKYDGTNDLHIGTKNDGVLRVGTAAENTETHQYACYSANGTDYFADPALSMTVANPDIVAGSGKSFYVDSGRYREIDNTVYYDSVALDLLTDSLVFTSESADQTEGTLTEVTGYVYEVTTHSPGTVTVNRSFGPVASINGTTLYSDLACTKQITTPVLNVAGQTAKVYWISADAPVVYSPDAGVTWFKNAVYHPSTNTITMTGPVTYEGVALSRQVYVNSTYEEVISTFPPAMMRTEEPGYDGLLIWDHAKMAADTLSMPTAADYEAAGSDTLALVRTREPTTGRQWYEWGEAGSGGGNGTTLVLTQSEYDTYSLITDMTDEHYIPNNALVIITDSEDEYLTAQEE